MNGKLRTKCPQKVYCLTFGSHFTLLPYTYLYITRISTTIKNSVNPARINRISYLISIFYGYSSHALSSLDLLKKTYPDEKTIMRQDWID